jgi:ribonuclease HII
LHPIAGIVRRTDPIAAADSMSQAPDPPLPHYPQDLLIAGVDEAGRGPLAGPVCAAAAILDPQRPIAGIGDSKKILPARRDALEIEIKSRALAWSVAFASVDEIDRLNILHATLLAMRRAVDGLKLRPGLVLVDGNRAPACGCEVRTIVGGDGSVPAIGAASILAKVARDRLMQELDLRYPGYGFAGHKGYPTLAHREALRRLGPCPEHRRSFGPVRALLTP